MATINEAMVFMKIVRERLTDLKQLRGQVSNRVTSYYGTQNQTVEPTYDVKKVDIKITELQNFLAVADAKIKSVNAKTEIGMEFDMDKLLRPIE